MAKKNSTALVFNPFGGILDTNPRRRRNMSKVAGGAIAVGTIAAVAAVAGAAIGSKAQMEAQGTDFFSMESMKSKAIVGLSAGAVAAVIAAGLAKFAS